MFCNIKAFLRIVPRSERVLGRPFATDAKELDLKRLAERAAALRKVHDEQSTYRPPNWDNALPFDQLPGPKPVPILGNFWRFWPLIGEFQHKPLLTFYQDMQKKYGNILIFKGVPGRVPLVIVYDPKDMETLLRSSNVFPLRRGMQILVHYQTEVENEIYGEWKGLLSLQGEKWYTLRSHVNPILMQPKVMSQYVTKINDISAQLVENMKYFAAKNANNEMSDNFQEELYKWALETVAMIGLDKRLGCLDLDGDENSEHRQYMRSIIKIFGLFYHLEVKPLIWKYIRTPKYMEFVRLMNFVTKYTKRHIDECIASPIDPSIPESQWSVVKRLAKENKHVAYVMVTDMLMAGIDTTGKTMAAILYFLAKNPEKQAILRKEIMEILPQKNGTLTVQSLENIPYTRAVIKEAIRIAPIAIGNIRTTPMDMVLGGYQIPKGTDVTTLTIMSANDERQFKDPHKFIPERWLRTTEGEYSFKNAHPFAYMPFGHGARACVGSRLANLELEVTIIKIIRNLELRWNRPNAKFVGYFLYGISTPLNFTVNSID